MFNPSATAAEQARWQTRGQLEPDFDLLLWTFATSTGAHMKNILSLPFVLIASCMLVSAQEEGFVSLFDGKTLDGWKINQAPESFAVEDGAIRANGDCSHLFYEGKVNGAKFKNFELRLDVMTRANSNGGFFIHTVYKEKGWPSGYEIQVNNTQKDPQKSGGLYNTVKNLTPFEDDKWMKYVITVKDGMVIVTVNDKELVNYKTEAGTSKLLPDGGTFSIQAHDKGSTTFYKNIRVKVLP